MKESAGLFDLTPSMYDPSCVIAESDPLVAIKVNWTALEDMILNKHYAGRMPSVTYSYGLFRSGNLVGGLTIGKPASPPLCVGLAGPEYKDQVFELNRLVAIQELPANALSWFVGSVMRALKETDAILVSFADAGVGHHGYIYQATNWVYTGRTRERTDKYMPGGKHPRHYTDEYAHMRKLRTAKHRYVHIPNKRLRRQVMRDLRYKAQPYPKGDNERYVLGDRFENLVLNTMTGETVRDSPGLIEQQDQTTTNC